jgi:3-oxoacyl-(acyl-carrier-protein) synthase
MKIAITGIGMVSAIGMNRDETLRSLLDEQSGIGAMRQLQSVHTDIPVGEVPYSDAELKRMAGVEADEAIPRTSLLGIIAAREALGVQNTDRCADGVQTELLCSDVDYQTAEMIGSKMLMHMAMAYRMIKGDEQETMPEVKGLDQRKVVFDGLKARYQLNDLIKEAQSQGVSRSSAIRWNNQWIEKGMVRKENHGEYRKVA